MNVKSFMQKWGVHQHIGRQRTTEFLMDIQELEITEEDLKRFLPPDPKPPAPEDRGSHAPRAVAVPPEGMNPAAEEAVANSVEEARLADEAAAETSSDD